jgi:hypothetical protein
VTEGWRCPYILPRRSFPPLECDLGVNPSQAAKWRPETKPPGSGTSALIEAAYDLTFELVNPIIKTFNLLGELREREPRRWRKAHFFRLPNDCNQSGHLRQTLGRDDPSSDR